MESKKRIGFIDAAKAIAIILVVIGHCHWLNAIPRLGNLIYTFHMPLFFVVSGFFLKELTVKNAIVKYSKAYLWPYLMIGLFIITIGIAKSLSIQETWYSLIRLNFVKILWGSNCESDIIGGDIPHIGPSWFLLALFWGCMLFSILKKIKGRIEQICLLLIGASFAICSSKIIKMPLSIQGGVICVIYLYIGNCLINNRLINSIFRLPKYIKLIALMLWLMVAAFVSGVDVGSGSLGFSIVGFIVSLVGTFFVLGICYHYNLNFGWIGRNTLYILCAHILIWRILDIFGLSSKALPFSPYVNFMVEATYEIIGALVLAWLLSKTGILEYKRNK